MGSFVGNVKRVFATLIREHGFVIAWKHPRFVSFVRYLSDDVFAYLIVSDCRSGKTGKFNIWLWVAPPESADDNLETLGIGYQICIYSKFKIDDEILTGCQRRIIELLPCLETFIPIIQRDCKDSAIIQERQPFYKQGWALFRAYRSLADHSKNAMYAAPSEAAHDLARGKGKFEKLEELCLPVVKKIVAKKLFDPSIYGGGEFRDLTAAMVLASNLCVHAQGELSKNKLAK